MLFKKFINYFAANNNFIFFLLFFRLPADCFSLVFSSHHSDFSIPLPSFFSMPAFCSFYLFYHPIDWDSKIHWQRLSRGLRSGQRSNLLELGAINNASRQDPGGWEVLDTAAKVITWSERIWVLFSETSVWSGPIRWRDSSCEAQEPIWLSRPYSSNCSYSKHVASQYYVKCCRRRWLSVICSMIAKLGSI